MSLLDTGLLKVNEAIQDAILSRIGGTKEQLSERLPPYQGERLEGGDGDDQVTPSDPGASEKKKPMVIFDIPFEGKVGCPTVSVFLYDVHEDLQVRHGQARHYDSETKTMAPERVNLQCCYLITCWQVREGVPTTHSSGPAGEHMRLNNDVLAALLASRTLKDVPGAICRVLPPNEHLNSLGSFWQSLGNKPRLSLSFMVTFPVDVSGAEKVRKIESTDGLSVRFIEEVRAETSPQ